MNKIIVKLILRHAATFAAAWLVKTGIMTGADEKTCWGAIIALAAILHSLYDKRALIDAEIKSYGGTLGLALALALPVLFLTGCAGFQTVTHESGYGAKGHVVVPVPGTQASLIDGSLIIGWFKTTTAIQPTGTNRLYTPSIAVADISSGQDSVAGGVGTNSVAQIGNGTRDKYMLISGDTVAEDATNRVRLDGYEGFNPLVSTNK